MPKLKNVDEQLIGEFKQLPLDYWDFKGEDVKELTHGLHNYPAVMVYPIYRNIINIVKKHTEVETLLDPFMGSGTGLVEGKLSGFKKVYGTDLNPLAVLLSKVKTTVLKEDDLDVHEEMLREKIEGNYIYNEQLINNINNYIEEKEIDITEKSDWGNNAHDILEKYALIYNRKLDVIDFKNMGYWFKPKVILELQTIKDSILEIEKEDFRNFFLICFSETVRYVSNTRNGEFKLYRMKKEKVEDFNPDVKLEFYRFLDRNIQKIKEFDRRCDGNCKTSIVYEDSRILESVPDNSIDLMVTSPPYGDSRTTVAYGQFSRPSLWWLNLEHMEMSELNQVDNNLLGGKKVDKDFNYELSSDTLRAAIEEISEKDADRVRDVYSFYEDLDRAMDSITKKMKHNSYQFWVVGNRTVKEVKLLTDRIIVELGEKYGLVEVYDIPRNIPNKVMPSRNSPTNEIGKTVSTMTNEHIVVLRKDRE